MVSAWTFKLIFLSLEDVKAVAGYLGVRAVQLGEHVQELGKVGRGGAGPRMSRGSLGG